MAIEIVDFPIKKIWLFSSSLCNKLPEAILNSSEYSHVERYVPHVIAHDGSMVLLYMVCHGSHQHTPNVSIYTVPYMDPMGCHISQLSIVLGKL